MGEAANPTLHAGAEGQALKGHEERLTSPYAYFA